MLLLDEPVSHLDINHQIECCVLELVNRLKKTKGLLVIMVIHDLNLAARYCGGQSAEQPHRPGRGHARRSAHPRTRRTRSTRTCWCDATR